MFESLPDIHISIKCTPMLPVTVASMDNKDHYNVTVDSFEQAKVYLLYSIEKLTEMQNDDTFCRKMVKALNKNIISSKIFCK